MIACTLVPANHTYISQSAAAAVLDDQNEMMYVALLYEILLILRVIYTHALIWVIYKI
jgi:hypothetical protein